MTIADTIALIAKIRRAQPINKDVLFVCAELERMLLEQNSNTVRQNSGENSNAVRAQSNKGRFNKPTYMRDYMRKRRADAKAAGQRG